MADYRETATDAVVRTRDGASIPNDGANRDRRAFDAWVAAGNVPDPYVPPPDPDAGTTQSRLVAAAYDLTIADGDVANIAGIFNLIAALYLDVGSYMLLFAEPQPDTDYFPIINGGAPSMRCVEKGADYLLIEAKDAVNGSAVDPVSFSVEVKRI
jgi:hypothetical protein